MSQDIQDNTERNLNDLMDAAKKKLEAQKQQEEQENQDDVQQVEDYYADMREDNDNSPTDYTDYPDIHIKYAPDDFNISENGYSPDYENENSIPYIDNYDTAVFEGGPGISQVNLWKKQFSKESVFHTQILNRHFIFRTLNRFEYKQIVSIENVDALYREEMICRTCVLWPYNYDFKTMAVEDSGYPSTLAEIIMENSGFTKEYGIEVL